MFDSRIKITALFYYLFIYYLEVNNLTEWRHSCGFLLSLLWITTRECYQRQAKASLFGHYIHFPT